MIELVGYPEGNIIRVTKPQFDKLNEMGYLNYDDEPNYDLDPEEFEATGGGGQWRFDNEDEEKIRKILIKGVGEMKLTREDIRKYGTEDEKLFLKEEIIVDPIAGKKKDSAAWLGKEYHMDVLKAEDGFTARYKTKVMNECPSCKEDGDTEFDIDWIDWYVDTAKGIAVRRGSCANGHGIFAVFKYLYTDASGESTY